MTPTETIAILKHLDGWPVQHHSTKKVQEAIDAAVEMIEVFSEKRITEVETALKASEERCATLTDALRSTAQTLAWMQHGKCRGFSDDLLTTNEALDKARAALENLK